MYKNASRRLQDAAHRRDLYHPSASPNYRPEPSEPVVAREPGSITSDPAPAPKIDTTIATLLLVTGAALYGAGWLVYGVARSVVWSGRKLRALVRRSPREQSAN